MNFDELKLTWEKEMNTPTLHVNDSIRLAQKADNRLKRGFYIEIFACVALFSACLLALLFEVPMNLLMTTSFAIMMVMCLYIPYRLLKARKSELENNWTLKNTIEREIDKLEKQRTLLSSVAAWYVAPLAIAIFLGSWGGYAQRTGTFLPDIGLVIYWIVALSFGVGIVVWNKISVRKHLEPSLEKLKLLLRQLESE